MPISRLSSGLYRRYRNSTGSVPLSRESRTLTAGREFHPALKRYVSDAKIAIIFTIAMLFLLLVSHYGNHIHHDGKHSQHYIVEGQILKLAALETDCP